MVTEAWSPIARGGVNDDPTIAEVAAAVGRTPAQVTLRWHVQRGDIVFPKSMRAERMRENFEIFDFELPTTRSPPSAGSTVARTAGRGPTRTRSTTSPTDPPVGRRRGAGPCDDGAVTASGDFRFRDIALAAYGPSVVNAIGHGAVMPVLALRARELGADVSTAALVVALLGIGSLLASLPAGAVVARIGERRTLTVVGCLDALAMAAAALTDSVLALGVAVTFSGMTWTAFLHGAAGLHDRRGAARLPGAGDVDARRQHAGRRARRAPARRRADPGRRPHLRSSGWPRPCR